jgi:hypothetical protein
MDAKLRSTWTTKAAQAGIAPQPAVQVAAVVALPVLPTTFNSAQAELRRNAEPQASEAGLSAAESVGHPAAPGAEQAPILPVGRPVPTLPSDLQSQAAAPVRISDLATGKAAADQEAPACRPGENAAVDAAPPPSSAGDRGEAASRAQPNGGQDQGPPLPHCAIEFDPDADEPEVIAHTNTPVAEPRAVARSAAQPAPQREDATTLAVADTPVPEGGARGESGTQAQAAAETAAALAIATSSAPPANETPLLITEATRGVGSAVVDPNMPTDSVVFASDAASFVATPDAARTAASDPVAEALAALTPADPTSDPLLPHLLIG